MLTAVHAEFPLGLNGHPVRQVRTEIGRIGWQPVAGVFFPFRPVDSCSHRDEWPPVGQIIGKKLSLEGCPSPCARIPRLFERDHVVNI